jgi:putative hydrolase
MAFGGFEGLEGFGGFDPSQLLRFLQAQGPQAAQLTAEVAKWVALEGAPEGAVDPASRQQFDDLTRAAQIQVANATGLTASLSEPARCVGRAGWIDVAVPALQPVLDRLAATLQAADGDDDAADDVDDPAAPFAGFLQALAPMLLGVQSGFMVGYLSRHLHGQHDLPLPVASDPGALFVVPNLDGFEAEWGLPRDELRFYVAINEIVHAAVLAVPWAQQRLLDLSLAYVSSLEIDASAIEDQLAGFDPAHPEELQGVLGDPSALLAAFESPGRRQALERLQQFTIVLEGYADAVLGRIGVPLIPAFDRIREARHRHRVERGDAQKFIERLLGIEMDRDCYERGAAFCDGVVERAGPDALNRLWDGEEFLPTPAELDASGLWLARLDVMGDS